VIVAFYARVSTDEQREQQTIRTQLEYARSRATLEGWTLQEFTDEGVSGTVPLAQRAGGRALLAAARTGEFEVVATFRLDRLGRTQRVVLDAIDQLKAAGAKYRSLTEPFEVGTPFGDAALGMTSVFSQLERDSIAQRTSEGRRRVARESGRYLGGPPPFGYRVDGKHLVVDEDLAGVVREIYRLYLEDGIAVDRVAEVLNARGVPSAKGARWHGSTISGILRDRLYAGEATFSGIRRDVPAIVTMAEHAAAAERAAANYRWKRAHLRRSYALRGLLRCECGLLLSAYTYYKKRDHSTSQKAYRCSYDHRLPTRSPIVKEDEALAALWSAVERFFRDPGQLAQRLVAGDTRPAEQRAEQELVELAERIRDLEAKELRLLDEDLAKRFRPETIAAKTAELRAQRDGLERRIRKVRASRAAAARAVQETDELRAQLRELQQLVQTANDETKARVLREFIRSTRVEYVAPHRARLHVAWMFVAAGAGVSSHVRDASASETSLETVHELGRAA
jgi:site-specific DNA recombinase